MLRAAQVQTLAWLECMLGVARGEEEQASQHARQLAHVGVQLCALQPQAISMLCSDCPPLVMVHSAAPRLTPCVLYLLGGYQVSPRTYVWYIYKAHGGVCRFGCWGEWQAPYLTLDPKYEAAQLRVFGRMVQRGHIYRGKKPVHWSPSSQTALAEAVLPMRTSPQLLRPHCSCHGPLCHAQHVLSLALWTLCAILVGPISCLLEEAVRHRAPSRCTASLTRVHSLTSVAAQELEYPDGHVSPSIYVAMPLVQLAESLSPDQAAALEGDDAIPAWPSMR